jgi:hypothetical protein
MLVALSGSGRGVFHGVGVGIGRWALVSFGPSSAIAKRVAQVQNVLFCDLGMPVVTPGKNWVTTDEGRPSLERACFILG